MLNAMRIFTLHLLRLGTIVSLGSLSAAAQSMQPYAFNIGSPTVTEYYVDPAQGSDNNSGRTVEAPLRTVQKVWNGIPNETPLSTGVVINLRNGTYGNNELPNYWELKRGTAQAPIIIRAAVGQQQVKFVRDINMANVSYFYLLNVEITPQGGGDTFHCESCDHILLRGNTLNGGSLTNGAHETLKVNQSQFVYIENNNIFFADDNAIDFVAVQYAHVIGNKIHSAQDWCMYVKGGSAYIRVEANEIYDCGTGGFTAGQGSGFQFMTSPWIHYEAYDIKFINNVVYNTVGAAFGVNGGYNVLIANNTAYNVGSRAHLIEVVFGERTCDGERNGVANSICAVLNRLGGWGAGETATDPEPVGNRNVSIVNNVVYNPASVVAPQHFAIYGPRTARAGTNLPSPQRADTSLVIKGNVIWNGRSSTPLGIEDSGQGCQASNSTCNADLLLRDNVINQTEPILNAAGSGDLRPAVGSPLLQIAGSTIESFLGGDTETSPQAPLGELGNTVNRDFSGASSVGNRIPGAYQSETSTRTPALIDDFATPMDPGSDRPIGVPSVSKVTASQKRNGNTVTITSTAVVSGTVTTVTGVVRKTGKNIAAFSLSAIGSSRYRGSARVKAPVGSRLTVSITAIGSAGASSKEKAFTAR